MSAGLLRTRGRAAGPVGVADRHRNTVATVALLIAAASASHMLCAQTRPDAGQTLEGIRPPPPAPATSNSALPHQDNRPAMSGPDSKRILVRHWRITGSHVFTAEQLEPLIREFRGQKLTLRELNGVAALITAYYRRHGYLLSRAYVPAQDIRENTVEIAVIEGHLADIVVTNNSAVAGSLITRHLERLRRKGPVEGHALERSLLLLSDLPGVDVRSTLMPGRAVGTSDLDVQVHPTSRVTGSIDADNFGNSYTGTYRGGGTLNINNPFHYGDVFSARVSSAGSGMNYGRVSWQTSIGGSGLKIGIADSELRYRLRGRFTSLDAHGSARVGTLWTSYPLLRSEYTNLSVQLSYDNKHLDDRVDFIDSDSRKTLGVWTLGVSGNRTDGFGGGGLSAGSLSLISGQLNLDPITAQIDAGEGGHHTEGRYGKLMFSFSRAQRLTDEVSLYAALIGQFSNKNLDTSETQSLGGGYGVRAYPQDEGIGDDAALINMELQWKLPDVPDVQTIAFVDAGTVRINHSPLPTDTHNRRYLVSEGFGVRWLRRNNFTLNAYLAWRSGPLPQSDVDRRPRAWIQFAQYF
jgi:hemolysin activation/secretion protein